MTEIKIKIEDAYYVGTHQYSFRSGEVARVVGLKTVYRDDFPPRVCFHVIFADGKDDWCPVEDTENYKLLTAEEVKLEFSIDLGEKWRK